MIRFSRPRGLALIVVAGLCASSSAFALDIPARKLSFVVEREGTPIGHHVLTFTPQGPDGAGVDISTEVAVKALFVTVYRFEHHGHEEWRDDALVRMASSTNDDGAPHSVTFDAAPGAITGAADGAQRSWPAALVPASLWNRDALDHKAWLNTVDGRVMEVTVTDLGDETLSLPEGLASARHYRLAGDLQRDLWYDGADRLVAVAFAGEDGSAIRYRLVEVIPRQTGEESGS